MLLGIRGGCNDPRLRYARCPNCGAVGDFRRHGSYIRWEARASASRRRPDRRVRIDTVLCRRCRSTHALIPPDFVPRSPYTKSFRRLVSAKIRGDPRPTVAQVCAAFDIEARTLYRICPLRAGPMGVNRL